jgi:ribonuclease HI
MAVIFDIEGGPTLRYAYRHNDNSNHGANNAELRAAMTAIKIAWSHRITRLTIYHDWVGVEHFSHSASIKPRHRRCCPLFGQYAEHVEKKRCNMRIRFVWVKGHSGDERNALADKMARRAIV